MNKLINEIFEFLGIAICVIILWQLLEFVMLGYIKPNKVDNVVAGILTISLYYNLKAWNRLKS